MNVLLNVALLTPEDNKVAYLSREIELPFVPSKGLILNDVHPDEDGHSLMVRGVCWHHGEQKLYVDLGEVVVPVAVTELSDEVGTWETAGWSHSETSILYPPDEEKNDAFAIGAPVKLNEAGGAIHIKDCIVHIYNGGNTDVQTDVETEDAEKE